MRQRVRPRWGDEELAALYSRPHDHRRWRDHELRVGLTASLARWLFPSPRSVADLSCGSGAIAGQYQNAELHLGDFAPGYRYQGPIEKTIAEIPYVDLFVHAETLEHVDDPDLVLNQIRAKADGLVLSTPVDAWDDPNPEHYWAWSRADVEEMLSKSGFRVAAFATLDWRPAGYCFGIWGCT